MGSSVRDRTAEFQQIVARLQQQQGLPSTSGRDAAPSSSASAASGPQSEFSRRAAQIGLGIHSTSQKLQKLAQLARRTGMFDDPAEEINELSTIVKQDIQALNQAISDMQTFSGGGPNKQSSDHSHTVVDSLRSRLKDATAEFKEVLTQRTDNLKAHQERKSMFSAAPEPSSRAPLFSQPGASFLPPNARNPLGVRGGLQSGGEECAPLLSGGQQQSQALVAAPQDQYLTSRAEALHQVESTIVELGSIFQQLAHMVHEQGEMAQRIDENVEDTLANVDAGQTQLLKYLNAISSNRFLAMKVFAVLLFFLIFFIVFIAAHGAVVGTAPGGDGGGGSGGGGGGGDAVQDKKRKQLKFQFELLGTLLVRYPALIGSIAVASGYFLHIDALGNMHWNAHDAMLGLQCALPIMAVDAALMLPDYSPGTTTKTIKLKAPRAAAERLRQQEAAAKGQDAGLPQQQLPSTQQSEQQAAPPLNAIITSVEDAPKAGSSSSSSTSSSPNEQQSDAAAAAPAAAVGTQAAAPVGAAAGSSGSSSTDEDLVEIEKTINVRADQPPMLSALYRVQLEKATDNVGRLLPYTLEVLLLLSWHLAEEMLWRAIVLTCAVGWTIDRLYEAGADETVNMLGLQLATPQAGALLAAVGCTAASLALLVQRSLFPIRIIAMAEEELNASEAKETAKEEARKKVAGLSGGLPQQRKGHTEKDRKRMRKVLEKVKDGMVRQRRWSTAIEGARDVMEWACYSTAFLLTGNLLAPFATAVSADLLFSGYQRVRRRQVDEAQRLSAEQIRELHKTALAIRDARLGVLQPPTEKKKKQEEKQQEQQNGGAAEQPAGTIAGTDAGSDPAAAESGSSEAPGAEKDVVGVGSSREP
ncbi:Qa-SYP3 Sed5p Syntaxin 5-type isoform A [Micractinium conductrix]|uniref:Qa-SYP3 Sed5p Syntaxin 5-type isoform A n=1 Tax=Micractinium conductrix TaxID=554055 RepID=A0A2P6V087_9CHLO|nr:Qa-SYP3 Sed5p Syntaxin 5-type isoform A [Micractinium conductrix]|eukprot:PSC67454.1 Qa-SYP3 Sed5p Syntaxin 5-type isoform A [Micractinium conductrix]